jgi:hypothetical protein
MIKYLINYWSKWFWPVEILRTPGWIPLAQTNWKRFGSGSGPFRREWVKRKISVKISGIPSEIRTDHLQNTSPERYRNAIPLCEQLWSNAGMTQRAWRHTCNLSFLLRKPKDELLLHLIHNLTNRIAEYIIFAYLHTNRANEILFNIKLSLIISGQILLHRHASI